jgi:hypothetical protein
MPSTTVTEMKQLGLGDRIALRILIVIAGTVSAVAIWWTVFSLRQKLVDGVVFYTFQLDRETTSVPFPDFGSAHILSAYQSSDVSIQVTGLSDGVVALVVLQHVLGLLLVGAIAGAFILLCLKLLRSKPFVRSMTITLMVLSIVFLVLGTSSELLETLTRNLVREEITGGRSDTPIGGTWSWSISGFWFVAGLGLAAIAGAFQLGERMQRDTEGLV